MFDLLKSYLEKSNVMVTGYRGRYPSHVYGKVKPRAINIGSGQPAKMSRRELKQATSVRSEKGDWHEQQGNQHLENAAKFPKTHPAYGLHHEAALDHFEAAESHDHSIRIPGQASTSMASDASAQAQRSSQRARIHQIPTGEGLTRSLNKAEWWQEQSAPSTPSRVFPPSGYPGGPKEYHKTGVEYNKRGIAWHRPRAEDSSLSEEDRTRHMKQLDRHVKDLEHHRTALGKLEKGKKREAYVQRVKQEKDPHELYGMQFREGEGAKKGQPIELPSDPTEKSKEGEKKGYMGTMKWQGAEPPTLTGGTRAEDSPILAGKHAMSPYQRAEGQPPPTPLEVHLRDESKETKKGEFRGGDPEEAAEKKEEKREEAEMEKADPEATIRAKMSMGDRSGAKEIIQEYRERHGAEGAKKLAHQAGHPHLVMGGRETGKQALAAHARYGAGEPVKLAVQKAAWRAEEAYGGQKKVEGVSVPTNPVKHPGYVPASQHGTKEHSRNLKQQYAHYRQREDTKLAAGVSDEHYRHFGKELRGMDWMPSRSAGRGKREGVEWSRSMSKGTDHESFHRKMADIHTGIGGFDHQVAARFHTKAADAISSEGGLSMLSKKASDTAINQSKRVFGGLDSERASKHNLPNVPEGLTKAEGKTSVPGWVGHVAKLRPSVSQQLKPQTQTQTKKVPMKMIGDVVKETQAKVRGSSVAKSEDFDGIEKGPGDRQAWAQSRQEAKVAMGSRSPGRTSREFGAAVAKQPGGSLSSTAPVAPMPAHVRSGKPTPAGFAGPADLASTIAARREGGQAGGRKPMPGVASSASKPAAAPKSGVRMVMPRGKVTSTPKGKTVSPFISESGMSKQALAKEAKAEAASSRAGRTFSRRGGMGAKATGVTPLAGTMSRPTARRAAAKPSAPKGRVTAMPGKMSAPKPSKPVTGKEYDVWAKRAASFEPPSDVGAGAAPPSTRKALGDWASEVSKATPRQSAGFSTPVGSTPVKPPTQIGSQVGTQARKPAPSTAPKPATPGPKARPMPTEGSWVSVDKPGLKVEDAKTGKTSTIGAKTTKEWRPGGSFKSLERYVEGEDMSKSNEEVSGEALEKAFEGLTDVNKALTAAAMPRIPRAMQQEMIRRNAQSVMTRGNSRFAKDIHTGPLTGEVAAQADVDAPEWIKQRTPVMKACDSCGRRYTLYKGVEDCPTCSMGKSVEYADTFDSLKRYQPATRR